MTVQNVKIVRTDSRNADFNFLIPLLDRELDENYGDVQKIYNTFNVVQSISTVVVAYIDHKPAGCGCFKKFNNEGTVEIKRMFVIKEHRGKGISSKILKELEKWAVELGFTHAILETGIKQYEAIRLYEKKGYKRIANYGSYIEMDTSVCMKKKLYHQ